MFAFLNTNQSRTIIMKLTPLQTFNAMKGRAKQLLSDLWEDDRGAVLSVEYVLVTGVLVTGLVPGLVAARNSINAGYANMGNTVTAAVPAPNFSGFAVGGANGNPIASVQGFAVPQQSQANFLQATQIAPIAIPSP